MNTTRADHASETYAEWFALRSDIFGGSKNVSLTGSDLSIADVVAVTQHGIEARLTENSGILQRVNDSVDFLEDQLSNGAVIYGVNTGFGGSADTRTKRLERLQSAAIQHLNVGILLQSDKGIVKDKDRKPENRLLRSHALPSPIVRAAMLVRCNSLLRGHSGVRLSVIEAIMTLISKGMTPVVPLRGSISASGDLSTLSYIAGAIEGNPDVFLEVSGRDKEDKFLSADRALDVAGLQPVRLQAKEGLGITNGTAPSCAAACIVVHQANQLALLIQLLTAMGTEALAGTAHNYHPFISAIRPHSGQTEAAANILTFLSGSKISSDRDPDQIGLAQDRYALRTAPQWIGPQLEDLLLATRQVTAELNSTTDNPLIDAPGGRVHHGGNFQAMAITSAMEKSMTAVQSLGRLIFAQSSELINNMTNKGLPPNLSADEPSESFTMKGFDVNMAAYMAELAYLAHPVSTHVQVAEMTNQSVNSMALVTARYALEAVEMLSLMAATYIYVLCQAVDLRVMQIEFRKRVPRLVRMALDASFGWEVADEKLVKVATAALLTRWDHLAHLDCADRCSTAAKESLGVLVEHLIRNPSSRTEKLTKLGLYKTHLSEELYNAYDNQRRAFTNQQNTRDYLSSATRIIYTFVRDELDIPFHRGVIDHPPLLVESGEADQENRKRILGTMAAEIYEALRRGDLMDRIMRWGVEAKAFDQPQV
ncbi:L-Aspartase-like protein [Apodospora peruviana]|uniref:L-Aspartase-like protein n=1 Tax=Apodospora peruviana TaxID=516989 RepID=A0AAE0ICC4_9PEZI|nr:L-Aspartase-like protein [Apodospora peruviana]